MNWQNFRNLVIFTVGHSNMGIEEFLQLLRENQISTLVDVRRFPKSKFHHFNQNELKSHLEKHGVSYVFLGDLLGGFRKGGYEAYMASDDFKEGIRVLTDLCGNNVCAIMCAEKLYFRCHRRFIARYLEMLGWKVIHI